MNVMRTNNTINENQLCNCTCDVFGLRVINAKPQYALYKVLIELWEAIVPKE